MPPAPPPSAGYRAPQYPYPIQPPKSSKGLIIGIVVAIFAVCVLFIAGVFAVVFGAMHSSDAYQTGIRAMHDPRVQQQLGTPVRAGWFVSGSIHTSGGSGSADLSIPVKGSAQSGTIYVVGKKSAGEWTYEKLVLEVDGEGQRIDLLEPATK
jgi:hypothetical protein